MNKLFSIVVVLSLSLFWGCKQESVASEPPAKNAASEAKTKITTVVFIGKKKACECTRKRIDTSFAQLSTALKGRSDIVLEQLQVDVESVKVEQYKKMRAIMVLPAIYLLDDSKKPVEVLQGEVSLDQLRSVLRR